MTRGALTATEPTAPPHPEESGRWRVLGGAALWLVVALLVVGAWLTSRQLFIVGVIVGAIFALGALGLTLIYGVLKFANFAHGDTMMLGAYLAFFALTGHIAGRRGDVVLPWGLERLPGATAQLGPFTFGYGLVLAAGIAVVALVLLLLAVDRLVYRPLRRRRADVVTFAMVSLGVAIALRSLLLMVWGPDPRFYVTGVYPAREFPFGITLKPDDLFVLASAVVLMAASYLALFRTKLGKAMRAMADNPELALVSGINTEGIVAWTWVLGGALAALAGVLLALHTQLRPDLGFTLILPVFAAAILGGIGNPLGALVGAMIVGIVQEVSVAFVAPGYKFAVAFLILILVLLLRPRGLFGGGGA